MLLLGWDDDGGSNRYTDNLAMLLAGETILELVLQDRVEVAAGRLRAVGATSGYPALDLALSRIGESRKPRTIKSWVQRLGSGRELRSAVLQRLVER